MSATFLFGTGFEMGDTGFAQAVGTTQSVQTTIKRSGDFALRVNPTGTATGFVRMSAPNHALGTTNFGVPTTSFANISTLYTRFYLYVATRPASGDEQIYKAENTSNVQKFELRLSSAGQLKFYDQAAVLQATGATVLALNTWYCIEVMAATGVTAAWAVRLAPDDNSTPVVEISGTCDTTAVNYGRVHFGKAVNRNSNSVDFYYDDIEYDSAQYPGQGKVIRLDPIGPGTYTQWTTGTYADVDDTLVAVTGHDSDSTYITSSTAAQITTVEMETAIQAGIVSGAVIHAIAGVAFVRDEGGVADIKYKFIDSSTGEPVETTTTGSGDPGASYVGRYMVRTTASSTSAWLASDLTDLEFGLLNNASVAARCTRLAVMVFYNEPAPTAPVITLASGTVTVGSATGGTPANEVGLFTDSVVTDPNDDNVTALLVFSNIVAASIGTLPSGWALDSIPGYYACTARTPAQLTLDLLDMTVIGLAVGTVDIELTVTDSTGRSSSATVTVSTVAPDLSIEYPDNTTYPFGTILPGVTTSHQFIIKNNGTVTDTLGTITVNPAVGWSINAADNPSGLTIAAGAQRTVTVSAYFTESGDKATTLIVPSSDPQSPYVLNITATVASTAPVSGGRQTRRTMQTGSIRIGL